MTSQHIPTICLVMLASLASTSLAAEFEYTVRSPGYVSAAIYDASGRQVRPLQHGAKQGPGTYRLAWDGLDRYGNAQPPGDYEWRVLRTPGFTREFLVNLGTNITWREHDYWVGNHFGPNCLMVDDEGVLYVGGVSSEGPPNLIKLSQDGRQLHWSARFEDGLVGISRIGRVLYLLKGDKLYIVRVDNGGGFWGDPTLRKYMEQTNAPRGQFYDLQMTRERKSPALTMAGGKDFLAVCCRESDEVRLIWLRDDAIDRDQTVRVRQPIHAATSPDGTLYVLTSTGIVFLDITTKRTRDVVVDKDLTKPGTIAFEPAFGDLLVTNGSQVRRYHAADGKLVATYGRTDGRTYGIFNPLEFDTLLSLAADGQGGFFTAELCPRRVAHFNGRQKHTLASQWFGGMGWEWQAMVDPADPTIAFLPIDYKHIGRAKIDYATKNWTLTHLFETPDEFSWGANATDQHRGVFPAIGGHNCWWSVRRVNGQTYLVNSMGNVMVVRVDDDRIVPVACMGMLHPTIDRRNPPAWWIGALGQMGINALSDEGRGTDNPKSFKAAGGYKHFSYTWADTNRNGRFDVEEVRLGSRNNLNGNTQCFVGRDWNIHCGSGMLPNESKDQGFPAWNWDTLRLSPGQFPEAAEARAVWADEDGSIYIAARHADHVGQDFAPLTWPNNSLTTNRLFKWDNQGRLLFATGRHTVRKDGPPGEFADLRAFAGRIRGNLIVRDACSPATVWTPDGLYAGRISREDVPKWWLGPGEATRENPSLGPYSDDSWGTEVIETAKGDVLWLANDSQNTMVIRVTGWDGWERQQGKLVLKTPTLAARKQGDGLSGEYFTNDKLAGAAAFRRTDPVIWFGPMRGDHRETQVVHPWSQPEDPVKIDAGTCSVRWTGFIEPPLTETMTFTLYTYGAGSRGEGSRSMSGAKVRMWVDDKLVIDSWDGIEPRVVNGYVYTRGAVSMPVPLTAGTRVPIKIEYAAAGGADVHLHLFWESFSGDPRHVPAESLYRSSLGG